MSATVVVVLAVLTYLTIGLLCAMHFHRNGHDAAAAAAVFTWPLLVEGRSPPVRQAPHRPRQGPYSRQIKKHMADLQTALTEPGVDGLLSTDDLAAISRALHAADARVGTVDRMLTDPAIRQAEQGDRLEAARAVAAAEVEAVLKGLVQLRVQLGLVALMGETAPVQDRIRALSARLSAMDEVGAASRLAVRTPRPRVTKTTARPTPPSPEDDGGPESPALG